MQSCVDVPIGKGVNVGGIKNGGTQEDIARHSCIVLAPLSVMGKTVIKRQNTMGGGAGSLVAVFIKCIPCIYWYICKSPSIPV